MRVAVTILLMMAIAGTVLASEGATQLMRARASGPIPGAIICPDYQRVEAMLAWYEEHAAQQQEESVYGPQQARLLRAPIGLPPLERYGCALQPGGHSVRVDRAKNVVPVVTATLPSGRVVRGVTSPALLEP